MLQIITKDSHFDKPNPKRLLSPSTPSTFNTSHQLFHLITPTIFLIFYLWQHLKQRSQST